MENLRVIMDSLVEATVIALDHIVHKLLYGFLLTFQLQQSYSKGRMPQGDWQDP